MSKNKYCPIHTDTETYQIIKFLAKAQGMNMTEFLEKHFKPLMQIGSTFNTNPFHLTYEFSLFPEPQLVIKAEGQSTFTIGQVDEKELEQERKAHFEEVKLSIAEINGKAVKIKEE